ncbi:MULTISPECIES: DUF2508 family protein [Acutalibacteraceae]|uniref:DUF2508 family protein n=1 Tax=Acutalibacteraceae TaxID=3082771 RepID=UPI0013E8F062|nr:MULTISPECIES: DUF2508 family protein [Acutalibacteraceae]
MESVLKLLQRTTTDCEEAKDSLDRQQIVDAIRDVSRQLAYNECWFQLESDENLIDACIYQREELKSRYRYFLKLAKQKGVNCASFQE